MEAGTKINRRKQAIERAQHWYARFERPLSSLSLIVGFLFNVVTLKRVDAIWENTWVVVHLLVIAGCIILINRYEVDTTKAEKGTEFGEKIHFWLTAFLQFSFGGLLSTFIVFYFRGQALAVTWPFLLILVIAFIANERIRKYYSRIEFQVGFFFLCTYLFMIFIVPVITHTLSDKIFLISGAISVGVLLVFLLIIKVSTRHTVKRDPRKMIGLIFIILISFNALYFLNIMPPLPLSLQDAGIYHEIIRTKDGNYAIREEPTAWSTALQTYFGIYPTYHMTAGDIGYAYSAVFSPVSLNTTIIHEWQLYDPTTKQWLTKDEIPLTVIGGRENGYRTYSLYRHLTTGTWRVNVKTESDQTIGRMEFPVVVQDTSPSLSVEIKS